MGRILYISGEYYVEFYGNGLKFQKKAGTSEKEAKEKLNQIEQSLHDTSLSEKPGSVTVKQFLKRYRAFATQVHPPKTLVRYERLLQHFDGFLSGRLRGEAKLYKITPRVIEQYKDFLLQESVPMKPRLVNFTLFLLRDMFEHSIKRRWLNDNPALHITWVSEPNGYRPKVYTSENINEIKLNLNQKEKLFLDFLLATGLMPNEAGQLQWSAVNLEDQSIEISKSMQKDKYIRTIPMDHVIMEIIKKIKQEDSSRAVFSSVNLGRAINYSTVRNTFAVRLLERGVSLIQLHKYMGSEDVAKVFRYRSFISPSVSD